MRLEGEGMRETFGSQMLKIPQLPFPDFGSLLPLISPSLQ